MQFRLCFRCLSAGVATRKQFRPAKWLPARIYPSVREAPMWRFCPPLYIVGFLLLNFLFVSGPAFGPNDTHEPGAILGGEILPPSAALLPIKSYIFNRLAPPPPP